VTDDAVWCTLSMHVRMSRSSLDALASVDIAYLGLMVGAVLGASHADGVSLIPEAERIAPSLT